MMQYFDPLFLEHFFLHLLRNSIAYKWSCLFLICNWLMSAFRKTDCAHCWAESIWCLEYRRYTKKTNKGPQWLSFVVSKRAIFRPKRLCLWTWGTATMMTEVQAMTRNRLKESPLKPLMIYKTVLGKLCQLRVIESAPWRAIQTSPDVEPTHLSCYLPEMAPPPDG